jgi:N-formylglutamate amidohydrolase
LLDVHSMPPPANRRDVATPHLVVGDLYGRAADARFSWRLIDEARDAGFRTALNTPYAGGHILARHASPARGCHAVQLEIGRQLYLDSHLDGCGPGLRAIDRLVARLAAALADEAMADPLAAAAE